MKHAVINQAMIRDVVAHMNEDHSDACLSIVKTLANKPDAQAVRMLTFDTTGVDFQLICKGGSEMSARVEFSKPITRESQIRGHLIALTKLARAATASK